MSKTTEFELLALFRDRMMAHAGQPVDAAMQAIIKQNGSDIVRELQENHGHSLADAVAMLRPILADLYITKQ